MTSLCRKETEIIDTHISVIGGIERIWSWSNLLSNSEAHAINCEGNWRAMWLFRRCQVKNTIFHSEKYKRVTARNNYTITYGDDRGKAIFGSILSFIKAEAQCERLDCGVGSNNCTCNVKTLYFALIEILEVHPDQLINAENERVITHIIHVIPTKRLILSKKFNCFV